jgi:hypothetical protein
MHASLPYNYVETSIVLYNLNSVSFRVFLFKLLLIYCHIYFGTYEICHLRRHLHHMLVTSQRRELKHSTMNVEIRGAVTLHSLRSLEEDLSHIFRNIEFSDSIHRPGIKKQTKVQ